MVLRNCFEASKAYFSQNGTFLSPKFVELSTLSSLGKISEEKSSIRGLDVRDSDYFKDSGGDVKFIRVLGNSSDNWKASFWCYCGCFGAITVASARKYIVCM
ncbi:hypothetical protein Y032_0232g3058 [Ancylostoma ceylanicum]|uniref:Uncharacterized protein n=1 Tax=Ancylostoma ceylanicum TaxID=53326 RepID=A0A016SFQ5_9BILA|nr:hypothetical protein Y032_0232g3058 [Ancylostoma ceylanicum]